MGTSAAPAVSNDLSYSGFDASDPSLFNFDNDTVGIIAVLLDSVDTTSENGAPGTVEVLVQLQTRPAAGATVPVTLASQDSTEGSA